MQQAALGQKNSRPRGTPPRGYENWDADAGVWRNDEGETPLDKQERHKEKIRMQHARSAADRAAKLIVDLHGVERPRDASHAAEYIGLTVKVPQSAFDDDPESELLAGLVWAYVRQRDGEASAFQIRFDPALKRADVRVSWDQLLGAEPVHLADRRVGAGAVPAGVGPGDGTVKLHLPDAHSDFIFAVAAEEYGALACLSLIGLYGFIVLRGFVRTMSDEGLFALLAGSSLLAQFGVQAAIHMASSADFIPTKGMTLPLISYGGSSLVASGVTMGLILALTRRRKPYALPGQRRHLPATSSTQQTQEAV